MRNIAVGIALSAVLIGKSACAADMGAPLKAPYSPPPAHSWTGCYAGGNGGAAWLNDNVTFDGNGFTPLSSPLSAAAGDGAAYGGQVGCDYQMNSNWVVGLRGMWDGTALRGTAAGEPVVPGGALLTNVNAETKSFATAVGRVGYSVTPALMIYGVGGGAFADNNYSQSLTAIGVGGFGPVLLTASDAPSGWVAGAGMSWMLGPNWDIWVEYNYLGFGNRTVNTTSTNFPVPLSVTNTVQQDVQTILVGIDFRFTNWAAGQFGLR